MSYLKIVEELQSYPAEGYSEEYLKIPAGRLLDELGWKGKKIGNAKYLKDMHSV